QQTPFWIINEQGFRDPDPVSPQKPEGEVRIFVLGGSAAFGQLSPNDQTLVSYHLEQLLNTRVASQRSNANRYQPEILPYTADEVNKVMNRPARIPDRQYRVINAAVPGYTSGNELALLMQEISTYSPDIIISLGGYSDLLLPSSQSAADIPGLDNILEGKGESWTSQASRGFNNWLGRFYLIKGIQRLTGQSSATLAETGALNMASNDKSSAQRLATTSAELDQRIARYQNHLLQLVRWSSASKKRVIIGLQPEVTAYSKAKPSAAEAEMLKQLGQPYADQIQAGYTKLAAAANRAAQSSANAKVLNLYEQIGQQDKSGLFVSPEGLSDAGSKMVADRFYGAIATQLALKPKPFGSP
ncbi:MAG: SGNH/GDSL hydrolase family protein, partial [Oculatellaceae cyanobacterium Prado106]|nr:SGNH/GDSL hydrolase family protein [Oculatellaceae cyanobacterium Prado106]